MQIKIAKIDSSIVTCEILDGDGEGLTLPADGLRRMLL